jgi:2',3'-cyclic-nucleotide 2'-phosphodiesterase (5'-nucleotidase family)
VPQPRSSLEWALDAAGAACPNRGVPFALPRALRAAGAVLSITIFAAACDRPGPGTGAQPPVPTPTAAAPEQAPLVEITVAGTADLHGRLSTLPVLGGYVRALRAKNPDGVVLVDAGDMFQGTLESNLNEGAAVVDAYRTLGYDAVAIGNHELDYGPVGEALTPRKNAKPGPDSDPRGALKARALQAKGAFPMLAANILEDGRLLAWSNVTPSVLVTKRGVQVGIIGVSTMETPTTTIAANVGGITMKPIAQAIVDEAKALREKGAKVVIVAAHAGGVCTKLDVPTDLSSCDPAAEIFAVARALPAGTVHAIVAGHTHKAVAHEVAGIPILQANEYGTHFGRVELSVDLKTGQVVRTRILAPEPVKEGSLFNGTTVSPAADVAAAVAPAIESARARRAESLGTVLTAPFVAQYRAESSLGNLVTSLLLELSPKVDIAVANGGGLRADLPAGELTYGALYDALPFDNRLAKVTMTGRVLRDTLTRNLTGKGGILSVAGARVAGRCEGGKLAVDVFLTGQKKAERPMKDEDRVLIVTSEFLATRGDEFGAGEKVEIDEDGPPFREPLAALLRKKKAALRPEDWLVQGKPRVTLPGPIGAGICGAAK